jgi:hypothetical protein
MITGLTDRAATKQSRRMIVRSAGGSLVCWSWMALLLSDAVWRHVEGGGVPADSTRRARLDDERHQLPGSLRRKKQVRNLSSIEAEAGVLFALAIDDNFGSVVPTRAPQRGPRPTRSPSAPVTRPTRMPQGAAPTAMPVSIATEAPTVPEIEPTSSPTTAPNPVPTSRPSLIPIPLPPSAAPVAVVSRSPLEVPCVCPALLHILTCLSFEFPC